MHNLHAANIYPHATHLHATTTALKCISAKIYLLHAIHFHVTTHCTHTDSRPSPSRTKNEGKNFLPGEKKNKVITYEGKKNEGNDNLEEKKRRKC